MNVSLTQLLGLVLLGLIITSVSYADIYTYTDKNGITHFTNQRPAGKAKKNYKIYLKTPSRRKARPGVVPVAATDKNVKRYSRFDESIRHASQTFSIPEPFIGN